MTKNPERAKTPESPLGAKLRVFAAQYATAGQRERAEGYAHAANTARNDPREGILRSNMSRNCPIVHVGNRSWKTTMPFEAKDFMVDEAGAVVDRGDDPRDVDYLAKVWREQEAAQ
jgi:hypothetical protein